MSNLCIFISGVETHWPVSVTSLCFDVVKQTNVRYQATNPEIKD